MQAAKETGMNPALAATSPGSSPFSLRGGLLLSTPDSDKESNRIFMALIAITVALTLLWLLTVAVGIVNY